MQIRLPIVALLAWLVSGHPAPAWSDAPQPAADAIAALLARDSADADAASLRAFYAARNDAPAWSDPAQVAALADALAKAADQGLDFAMPKAPADGATAARDVALIAPRARLCHGARQGARARSTSSSSDWAIPAPSFDAAAGLSAALKHDLAAWYRILAAATSVLSAPRRRARALSRDRSRRRLGAGAARRAVEARHDGRARAHGEAAPRGRRRSCAAGAARRPRPGAASDAGAMRPRRRRVRSSMSRRLRRRVRARSRGRARRSGSFDGAVEEAVRRFQRRYGIAVDGAVGPRTLAAMNVPARARVEQIELNLERWRSLPHDLGVELHDGQRAGRDARHRR